MRRTLNRMWRGIATIVLLCAVGAAPAAAQQLRIIAVFNLDRVLLSFYQDSSAVREFRQFEQQFRDDLTRAEQSLRELQVRRQTALDRNDSRAANALRADIEVLQDEIILLQERWFQQQTEMRSQLAGDDFYRRLYDTVDYVAQDNGYTVVLEETALGSALFWFSPLVDITDAVITELLRRFR